MEEGAQPCEAARNGDTEKLKDLILAGADVNPWMHAAKLGHAEAVTALLEAGAPWNALSPSNLFRHGHEDAYDLLLNAGTDSSRIGTRNDYEEGEEDGDSDGDYLEDRVSFSSDKLMDSSCKGVMMAWEHPLMEAHAKAVCSGGGHVLNIGFGMGLVETAIQKYSPSSHTNIGQCPRVFLGTCSPVA